MAHKIAHKETVQETSLKDTSYVAWRMMQGRRRLQENLVKKGYNERARLRHDTRH